MDGGLAVLEKLSKEGELGRRKITQYTRYGTVALCIVQSLGIAFFLERNTTPSGFHLVTNVGWGFRLMTILTLSTGTAFVMWLGEQITERGIGNGMSLIIFAGIVVNFPRAVMTTLDQMRTGQLGLIRIIFLMALMAIVVAAIIFVERGHRRVTVQYAKRVVGRRMYGGSSTHIPLKVNTGGVIPVIFASSILAFREIRACSRGRSATWPSALNMPSHPAYRLHHLFAYFYTAIIFNPMTGENMRNMALYSRHPALGKRPPIHHTILARITAGAPTGGFAILNQCDDVRVYVDRHHDADRCSRSHRGMNIIALFGGPRLDRRRRGDGCAAGRVAVDHAPL
jgi:preprotein translocase subunit SecY